MNDDHWTDRAACKTRHGGVHELAYVERDGQQRRENEAKRQKFLTLCRTSCQVRHECLEAALAFEVAPYTGLPLRAKDRHGIWGGYLPHTRERIADDRRNHAEQ